MAASLAPQLSAQIITREDFLKAVAEKLETSLGVPFSADEHGFLVTSHVSTHKLQHNLRNFLHAKGYRFKNREVDGVEMVILEEGVNWWLPKHHLYFCISAYRTDEGVVVFLRNDPEAQICTGPQQISRLASELGDFYRGTRQLHPLVSEFARRGGERLFGWEELEIVPNIPLELAFSAFAASSPSADHFIHHVAKQREFNPFSPSLYHWTEGETERYRAYVPRSFVYELQEGWRHQWNRFLRMKKLSHP